MTFTQIFSLGLISFFKVIPNKICASHDLFDYFGQNKANERLWININHIDNEVNYNIVNW